MAVLHVLVFAVGVALVSAASSAEMAKSGWKGVRIKSEKSMLTFGAKEEVRVARTAEGELLVTANKVKIAGKLEVSSLNVADGSGGGKKLEDRLGALENRFKKDEPKASDCVPGAAGKQAYSKRDATVVVCDGKVWQPRCKPYAQDTGAPLPKSCFEVQQRLGGQRCAPARTARYMIKPDKSLPAVEVLCDFEFDGGGWTVWAGLNTRNYKMTVKDNANLHVLNHAGKFNDAKHAPRSYAQTESSNLAISDVLAKSAWSKFDFMLFNRNHDFHEVWEGQNYNGKSMSGCKSIFYAYPTASQLKTYGHHIPLGCVQHGWQGGTSSPMYHSYACKGNPSKACDKPAHCTGCHRCFFTQAWSCDPFTTYFAVREPTARLPTGHPNRGKSMPLPSFTAAQLLDVQRLSTSTISFKKAEPKLRQCGGFSAKTISERILEACFVYGNGRPMYARICDGSACGSLTALGKVIFSSPVMLESIAGTCWNGFTTKAVYQGRPSRMHLCSTSAGGGVYNGKRGVVIWQPVCDSGQHGTCMHVNDKACSGANCKMYWYYKP